MFNSRKTITVIALLSLAILTTASTVFTGGKYKNLKVLPKDISEKTLDSLMDTYTKALKVSCDFCHVAKKEMFGIPTGNKELDFALDMPMKEEARKMIRLTIDINRTYFNDSTKKPENLTVVSCNTCHRGDPFPAYD